MRGKMLGELQLNICGEPDKMRFAIMLKSRERCLQNGDELKNSLS